MKNICVITGGGSGMGLAAAKILGKDFYIIIAGRSMDKLENALVELRAEGIKAEPFSCDVSKRVSVNKLAAHAKELGSVSVVINAAGMSPNMGEPKTIMEANALGAINIHNAFYEVIHQGGCLIDIASMAGHIIPKLILPQKVYKHSRIDEEAFIKKMMSRVNLFPRKLRAEISYSISKNFVIWYAKTDAARFGNKGVRVLSISPGSFETPMGEIEKDTAAAYTKYCAIKRFGYVEEIASLIAFCAGDKVGYLTGTDILCDGGCVASGFNPLKK